MHLLSKKFQIICYLQNYELKIHTYLTSTKEVFSSFGSWFQTIRDGIYPSEQIVALAMRNSLPEFLVNSPQDQILVKFIKERIDLERQEGLRILAA